VPDLPDTSAYAPPDRLRHPDYVPTPPADPELPRPEPGVRPARPLPYDLAADARVADGALKVDFASLGATGAIRLGPGRRGLHPLPVERGWYDVDITSDLDKNYLRRLVGHVETGEPGISQP
jgi:hypothetical protein